MDARVTYLTSFRGLFTIISFDLAFAGYSAYCFRDRNRFRSMDPMLYEFVRVQRECRIIEILIIEMTIFNSLLNFVPNRGKFQRCVDAKYASVSMFSKIRTLIFK